MITMEAHKILINTLQYIIILLAENDDLKQFVLDLVNGSVCLCVVHVSVYDWRIYYPIA